MRAVASTRLGCLVAAALACSGASAHAATVSAIDVTAGGPHTVVPSRTGTELFVGARDCGYIGRLDLATRTFARTLAQPTLPCATDPNGSGTGVFSMVEGPDGKLYFSVYDPAPIDGNGLIARANPDGTDFQSFAAGVHPLDVVNGPDGKVWFTVNGPPGKVGRVDPATFNVDTFNVPGAVQGPRGIVAANDGNLYVLGGEAGKIWKVTTAAVPSITEVKTGLNGPSFGELGPDGRVWFAMFEGDGVAAYDPATGQASVPLPVSGNPWDVTFGGDGKGYVTHFTGGTISQFVPGSPGLTTLSVPGGADSPAFAARGSGGEVYVADKNHNRVLDIITDQAPSVVTGAASAITHSGVTVTATVDARRVASTVRIEFGTTTAYGATTSATDVGSGAGARSFDIALTDLTPSTTYHYRAVASNANGTVTGSDATFTTTPAPPLVVTPPVITPLAVTTPGRVRATVRARWKVRGARTAVKSLSVSGIPAGATLRVGCSGRGCPFKSRIVKRGGSSSVSLTKLFARRRLAAKAVVEIRVTVTGSIGHVVRFRVRRRAVPTRTTLCLPPGATRPQRCA